MQRAWLVGGLILATLVALCAQTGVVARSGFLLGDFHAFYCAARVASQGADPYRTQPLSACERAIGLKVFFQKNPSVTIPAPLPGYAIAALEPLARLPFGVAAVLWILLLLLAWAACVVSLARCAGIAWEVSLAVFALSLGALSLPFGEIVPLSLACTCLAGYAAWKGRAQLAALAAAGAMIEPHLGLPVCLALAVWLPRARIALALCLGALAAVSLAALGTATNLEYFTAVLPAHALSEVTRDTQYSLSALLAALGLPLSAAIRAGGLWYVVMLVAGTLVAGRFARLTRNDACLALIPPAFAVFGGSFIHITQLAAAAPAAVLAATHAQPRHRSAAVIALLLLAVPWGWVVSPALIVAPLVPVAYLAWHFWKGNLQNVLLAALAGAALVFGLQHLYTLPALHLGVAHLAPAIDPRLPEASWSAYARSGSGGSIAAWAVRIPTWIGLGIVLTLLTSATRAAPLRVAHAPALGLALCCTILPIAAQFGGDRAAGWLGVDARAYYCASLAQRAGANPYYATSLRECEATTPRPYYRPPAGVTVPAPYPPYVLALLLPLTVLPFASAAMVWWTLLAFAIAVAAYALARAGDYPLPVGWGALGLSLGLTSFSTGNMMPLGLAAVALAGLCVQRARFGWAAAAMTAAMIEPQIALPAALALFVAFPAARVALAAGLGLLAALAVASAGFGQTLAYLTSVLPAHALAEVSRDNQYSLATVVAALGVPDKTAALLGSLSYAGMTALGVVVALRLARRYDEPALAIFVPPAFSLLGGSFVHTGEIAAAIPAALLLSARAGDARTWFVAALLLLAVPWMFATSIALFLAPLFPVAYLVYELVRRDRTAALAAAAASFGAIALLFSLAASWHGHWIAHPRAFAPIDPLLAEASWRAYVLNDSTNNPVMWLLRLPTWIGLFFLAIPALLLATKPRLALTVQSA